MGENSKIYFPIKVNVNKCKAGVVCLKVLNAETFEVFDVYTNNLDKLRGNTFFDLNTFKYNGDDSTIIKKDSKVVVYDDEENDLYGVVSFTTHAQLWWIPKKNIELLGKPLEDLLNYKTSKVHESLYKVDKSFDRRYMYNKSNIYRIDVLKYSIKASMSVSEFSTKFNLAGTDTEVQEDKKPEQSSLAVCAAVEKAEAAVDKTESNGVEAESNRVENTNIENIVKDLVAREITLAKKESELLDKEEALKFKEKELSDREVNLVKNQALSDDIVIADVEILSDNIADIENTSEDIDDVDKAALDLYDIFFKNMKEKDSLTVPFNIFKQLTIYTKGPALDKNLSYTRYTQMAVIKTDKTSLKGVFVILDVCDEQPVRVTILREYGVQNIDNSVIAKYVNDYRVWKREYSYIK